MEKLPNPSRGTLLIDGARKSGLEAKGLEGMAKELHADPLRSIAPKLGFGLSMKELVVGRSPPPSEPKDGPLDMLFQLLFKGKDGAASQSKGWLKVRSNVPKPLAPGIVPRFMSSMLPLPAAEEREDARVRRRRSPGASAIVVVVVKMR